MGGHYVTLRRTWHKQHKLNESDSFFKTNWYYTSDETIHFIDKQDVLNNEAYLLFYET